MTCQLFCIVDVNFSTISASSMEIVKTYRLVMGASFPVCALDTGLKTIPELRECWSSIGFFCSNIELRGGYQGSLFIDCSFLL